METYRTIKNRVSIREYKKAPVDKKLLEKLVDAGRRAPTARAVEPWEFIVVTDEVFMCKIGTIVAPNGTFVKDAACCIVIASKDTKYYLEDGCAATENILLCAADLGLGACWIAGDKKQYCSEVLRVLSIPSELRLISIISIGWPRRNVQQRKNRSLEDVIHWEKF